MGKNQWISCMVLVALLFGYIPIGGNAGTVEAAGSLEALPSVTSAVYENYESGSIGDPIYTAGNYQITVQEDPTDSSNHVARQLYGSTALSGFGPGANFPALTGTIVFEEKVRLEGSGSSGMYFAEYMRTQTDNLPVMIWRLQQPGSSYPGLYITKSSGNGEENIFPADLLQTDAWYSIRTVLNTGTATFDIYLFDEDGNRLYADVGRLLPIVIATKTVDYSAGFKSLFSRHNGSTTGTAATYYDDRFLYSVSNADHAEFLVQQAETGRRQTEIQYANAKTAELDAGALKTALEARLATLKADMLLAEAEAAVAAAELSRSEADISLAYAKISELPDDVDATDLLARLDALDVNANDEYIGQDYDNLSIGDILYNQSNYDVRVAADPTDANNLTAKMTYGMSDTSGFANNGSNFNPAVTGTAVYEMRLRFEGSGSGMYYLQMFRTEDGNKPVTLFRVNGPGNAPGVYVNSKDGSRSEERLAGDAIANDRWYRIITVLHMDSGSYDIYIVDDDHNEIVDRSTGGKLPITDYLDQPIDYSMGVRSTAARMVGKAASYGAAALYMDDMRMYGNTEEEIATQIGDILSQMSVPETEPGVTTAVYENFESGSIGDPIYTSNHYDITVQEDPADSGNHVARQLYGSIAPTGFGPGANFPALTGTIVFDEKVRLEGSGSGGMYFAEYMRTQTGKLVAMWRVQHPGANPGLYITKAGGSGEENVLPAGMLQSDTWYSIRTVLNTETASFDIYLFDKDGNRLYGDVKRLLPITVGGSAIDYTAGFTALSSRHSGSTTVTAATYYDDRFVYSMTDADHAEFLVEQAEIARRRTDIQYADAKTAELDAGPFKSTLEARLTNLRADMLAEAEAAVSAAEASRLEADALLAYAKLSELPDDLDAAGLLVRLDALGVIINNEYIRQDYEDLSIGNILYDQANYDVRVAADPVDANNLTAKMTYGTADTGGFSNNGSNFDPALTGTLVYEMKLRFEGAGTGLIYLQMFRTEDGNQPVNLFRVQGPGNAPGVYVNKNGSREEERLAPGVIASDRWYRIMTVLHMDSGTYDIYIIDDDFKEIVEQSSGRKLPITDYFGQPIDYSKGIRSTFARISGKAASYGAAALYMDDLRMYGNTDEKIATQINNLMSQIRENTRYYSAALQERLNDSIVLYPNQANGYVDNSRQPISADHAEVRPEWMEGTAMAPVEFLSLHMGLTGSWDVSHTVYSVSNGTTNVQIEEGLSTMTVNGSPVALDHAAVQGPNALLVPVDAIVQAFGQSLYQDVARNLWVISGNPSLFDPIQDGDLLDELESVKYGIRKPAYTIDVTTPEPTNAAIQEAEFNDRNTPANLENLALELADALDPSVAVLADFRQLIADEDYEGALAEFRRYFLNKLRGQNDFNWNHGLLAFYLGGGDSMPDEMLYDVLTFGTNKMDIGEPGRTNWLPEAPVTSPEFEKNKYMWHIGQFYPLLSKFNSSGNWSFLDKWAEFIDDWSLHAIGYDSILPGQIMNNEQSGAQAVVYLLKQLRLLAAHLPEDGEGLPAATLARVLLKMQQEYPPISIVYASSNPQNWTTGLFTSVIMDALLLSEFKDSAVYLREGLRRMEDYGTTNSMPDGTDSEQSISYNREDLRYGAGLAYHVVKALRPDLMPADREDQVKARLMARAKLMAHSLTAEGLYPSGFRIDMRDWLNEVKVLLQDAIPEALADPNIAAILAIASGDESGPAPAFNSEWFPYGGYSFVKESWERDSQEAFLFSSSHTGNYGYHTNQGNNVLALRAFGQDMLVVGEVGAYDYNPSPVLVDGLSQNDSYGIDTWDHRQVLVSNWDEPANLRWYESDSFNFTEGLYDRHYGDVNGIDDVAHQRMLTLLRGLGLWIVTDRMISDGTDMHEYRMDLRLPSLEVAQRASGYKAFDPGLIDLETIDSKSAAMHTAQTQVENMGNLSIYQFGSAPISTFGKVEDIESSNTTKVSDFYRLSASFSGIGDQALVSVVYPRSAAQDEDLAVTPLNGNGIAGFEAVMPDGKLVQYQAAADKDEQLTIGSASIRGEALLLVTELDGSMHGMAMGVIDNAQTDSFEFEIRNGAMQRIGEINTPVGEVAITPGADVFIDSVTVAMTTSTVDAAIRYTLDGSDPTPSSQLYNGPITLTDTTTIKARAFREGVTEVPITVSGTEASSIRTAKFTKQTLRAAAEPVTTSGLDYNYYEGDWKDLMFRMDRAVPIATGAASGLFDFSAKSTDGVYAFEYSGWLDVPASGVYTFRAPHEWLYPNIMSGYDLQLFIGDEQWYPNTGRQSFGTWSIALEAGKHPIRIRYVDYRGTTPADLNVQGLMPKIWEGVTPELTISGPGMSEQAIPAAMLSRTAEEDGHNGHGNNGHGNNGHGGNGHGNNGHGNNGHGNNGHGNNGHGNNGHGNNGHGNNGHGGN